MTSRSNPLIVRALAFGAAGVVTAGLLAALEFGSAQQHRQALWVYTPDASAAQQVEIVGQRLPRS
jgi:hypothetical protein